MALNILVSKLSLLAVFSSLWSQAIGESSGKYASKYFTHWKKSHSDASQIVGYYDYENNLEIFRDEDEGCCFLRKLIHREQPVEYFVLSFEKSLKDVSKSESVRQASSLILKVCQDYPVFMIPNSNPSEVKALRRVKRKRHQRSIPQPLSRFYGGDYAWNFNQESKNGGDRYNERLTEAQVHGQVDGQGMFSGQAGSQRSYSHSQVQLMGKGLTGSIRGVSGDSEAQISLGSRSVGVASSLGRGPSKTGVDINLGNKNETSMGVAYSFSQGNSGYNVRRRNGRNSPEASNLAALSGTNEQTINGAHNQINNNSFPRTMSENLRPHQFVPTPYNGRQAGTPRSINDPHYQQKNPYLQTSSQAFGIEQRKNHPDLSSHGQFWGERNNQGSSQPLHEDVRQTQLGERDFGMGYNYQKSIFKPTSFREETGSSYPSTHESFNRQPMTQHYQNPSSQVSNGVEAKATSRPASYGQVGQPSHYQQAILSSHPQEGTEKSKLPINGRVRHHSRHQQPSSPRSDRQGEVKTVNSPDNQLFGQIHRIQQISQIPSPQAQTETGGQRRPYQSPSQQYQSSTLFSDNQSRQGFTNSNMNSLGNIPEADRRKSTSPDPHSSNKFIQRAQTTQTTGQPFAAASSKGHAAESYASSQIAMTATDSSGHSAQPPGTHNQRNTITAENGWKRGERTDLRGPIPGAGYVRNANSFSPSKSVGSSYGSGNHAGAHRTHDTKRIVHGMSQSSFTHSATPNPNVPRSIPTSHGSQGKYYEGNQAQNSYHHFNEFSHHSDDLFSRSTHSENYVPCRQQQFICSIVIESSRRAKLCKPSDNRNDGNTAQLLLTTCKIVS